MLQIVASLMIVIYDRNTFSKGYWTGPALTKDALKVGQAPANISKGLSRANTLAYFYPSSCQRQI
jgi:hypothetical protein